MMSSLTDERFDRRGLLERAGWLAVSAGALPAGLRRGEAPDLAALQRRIAGTVVAPGAAGYDAARLLYSPRFDGTHPLAVVYCESAADVSRTILWARLSKVPIAARSGGHSYGVLDDAGSRDRRVEARLDHRQCGGRDEGIGAGARLMDVYRELAARGLTIPAGSCPSVGIAGLALGGGLGSPAAARPHLRQPPELHDGDRGRVRQAVQPAAKPRTCSGPAAAGVAVISGSPHGSRSRPTR